MFGIRLVVYCYGVSRTTLLRCYNPQRVAWTPDPQGSYWSSDLPTRNFDVAIIGGGIIGLATAMRMAGNNHGSRLIVLEKEDQLAKHQTGHNSGVIHAGIYYAPGSSKANFCSTGGSLLRKFCDDHDVPYDMCGKVIVATDESEIPGLEELFRRGTVNGAVGLRIVDRDRLLELEPHAAGVRAIHSPGTGIIDFVKVSNAYADEFRHAGGEIVLGAEVQSVAQHGGIRTLETNQGNFSAKYVINCAGLQADRVAVMMGAQLDVQIVPFRGEYFTIRPESAHLVKGLIYPVPDPKLPFLGVHFTKRIDGSVEAGPNAVMAFAREGYGRMSFKPGDVWESVRFPGFWKMALGHWKTGLGEQYRSLVKGRFLRSLQVLVPEIAMEDLGEPGAGVRAQVVSRSGDLLQDFSIASSEHAIHVISAPSPGATSSLAIADHISELASKTFGL